MFIVSACYSASIIRRFAMDNCPNIIRIYDTSKDVGLTRNWGIELKPKKLVDIGTQLCYWLFDVFYEARNSYETAENLLALNGNPKPNENDNVCTIHIEGESKLLSEPFFGSQQPVIKLCQPPGIVTKNYSHSDILYRPRFSISLQKILEKMRIPPEFWDYCYSPKVSSHKKFNLISQNRFMKRSSWG